jgi:hypothetical protein
MVVRNQSSSSSSTWGGGVSPNAHPATHRLRTALRPTGWAVALALALALLTAPSTALASPPTGGVCERSRAALENGQGQNQPPLQGALIPCRYGIGADAGEPSFGFGRGGEVFYETWDLDGPGNLSGVVRSNLTHTSFTDVSPPGLVTSFDPYLLVDPRTGRIFDTNFAGHGSFECETISFSDDRGAHWTTNDLCGVGFDGGSLGVGPPVSSHPSGYPNVVYYCASTTLGSAPPATSPTCAKSLDGGSTFALITPPYPTEGNVNDEFAPWAGPPVVGPDGTVYVPKRYGGEPMIAISHDEGTTWTRVQVSTIGSSSEQGRVAIDRRGDLFYSWQAANHMPYLASSSDGGHTWSTPIALVPPGVTETALARVDVTPSGETAAVVYLGSTNAPGVPPYSAFCQEFLETCNDGAYANATWNGYMTVIGNPKGRHPTLRTDTVNRPEEPLFMGGCTPDGGCRANLDFLDVKFDGEGNPWGAFVDDCALVAAPEAPALFFNPEYGRCEDGTGEGLLLQLRPSENGNG